MPPGRFANYIIHRAEAQTPKYSNELQRASTVRSGGVRGRLPTIQQYCGCFPTEADACFSGENLSPVHL